MLFSHWGVKSCHLVRQVVHCVNRMLCDTVSFSRWTPMFHRTPHCQLYLQSSVDGDDMFLLIVCVYHDTLSMLSAIYYAHLDFLFVCHFRHILELWKPFNIMWGIFFSLAFINITYKSVCLVRYVVLLGLYFSTVPKDHSAYKTWRTVTPETKHNIPEDMNLQLLCENLKLYAYIVLLRY